MNARSSGACFKSVISFVTHSTFQELLLSPFNLHEILEFDKEHASACKKSLKYRFCDFEAWIEEKIGAPTRISSNFSEYV